MEACWGQLPWKHWRLRTTRNTALGEGKQWATGKKRRPRVSLIWNFFGAQGTKHRLKNLGGRTLPLGLVLCTQDLLGLVIPSWLQWPPRIRIFSKLTPNVPRREPIMLGDQSQERILGASTKRQLTFPTLGEKTLRIYHLTQHWFQVLLRKCFRINSQFMGLRMWEYFPS